jgi:hypothetical protein
MARPTFYSERARRFAQRIEMLLLHAFPYLDEARGVASLGPPTPDQVHLHSRPHVDEAGREVQYCAVQDDGTGCAVVYRDWKFMYRLRKPTDGFWQAFHGGRLPATDDPSEWAPYEAAD